MNHPPPPWWVRYGIAVGGVVLAGLVTWLVPPLRPGPFPLFMAAVTLSAWYGGWRSALVTIFLSVLAVDVFFVEPEYTLRLDWGDVTQAGVFVLVTALVVWFAEVRRRSEQAVREQKEWLRVTLASIGDAVIATDTQGRVVFLNAVAERLTGWAGKEAHDIPLGTVFRVIDEKSRQPVENPGARALGEGTLARGPGHSVLIAKDGQERPVDTSAAPIRDEQGTITGAVLVFRDVSEARRAEEALREADRRKDEFLATLGHELRNPLAPLRNALQILRLAGGNPAVLEQTQALMERQVQQIVRLVDDLLDVSRIARGKVELRKERVELATVVHTALDTSRPLVEACGHRLNVTLPPEPAYLEADPARLAQVLANLVNNAAKYMDPGGHIWLIAGREGDEMVVRVRDTGIGIAAEMLPRVFEMFTQADHARGRAQGGLGIGLSLVRRLVEMHGGRVEATSAGPGQGSEFVVRLPATEGGPTGDGGRPLPLTG